MITKVLLEIPINLKELIKMKKLLYISLLLTSILIASCVQETKPKTIHFKLDMRGVQSISNVGLRGGSKPLSWESTFLLTDHNNDSIYEGTVKLKSASYDMEFKFVNQNYQFELQEQKNRSIKFEYKPETILYEAVFNNPNEKISILK
jgi:hypothetical protein